MASRVEEAHCCFHMICTLCVRTGSGHYGFLYHLKLRKRINTLHCYARDRSVEYVTGFPLRAARFSLYVGQADWRSVRPLGSGHFLGRWRFRSQGAGVRTRDSHVRDQHEFPPLIKDSTSCLKAIYLYNVSQIIHVNVIRWFILAALHRAASVNLKLTRRYETVFAFCPWMSRMV